eukprot:8470780-Pyramimonas_sp.AAC.1
MRAFSKRWVHKRGQSWSEACKATETAVHSYGLLPAALLRSLRQGQWERHAIRSLHDAVKAI